MILDACTALCTAAAAEFGGGGVTVLTTIAGMLLVWYQGKKRNAATEARAVAAEVKAERASVSAGEANHQIEVIKASLAPPPMIVPPPSSSGSSGNWPPIRASVPDPSMLTGDMPLPAPAIAPKVEP